MIEVFNTQISRRAFTERIRAVLAVASVGGNATKAESKLPEPPVIFSNKPKPAQHTKHLTIGCLVLPRQDQIDFTGPFEVFARIPNSTVHVISKTKTPIRDVKGLILTPEMIIAEVAGRGRWQLHQHCKRDRRG